MVSYRGRNVETIPLPDEIDLQHKLPYVSVLGVVAIGKSRVIKQAHQDDKGVYEVGTLPFYEPRMMLQESTYADSMRLKQSGVDLTTVALVMGPAQWQHQFLTAHQETPINTRLDHARTSAEELEVILASQQDIQWVENVIGEPKKAADEIVTIAKGGEPTTLDGRRMAEHLLVTLRSYC